MTDFRLILLDHITYVSTKVVRLLMGMPLVIMQIGPPGNYRLYAMAKEGHVDYIQMYNKMQKLCVRDQNVPKGMTKDLLRSICCLASSQKDSMLIKYVACTASGKGAKKLKKRLWL